MSKKNQDEELKITVDGDELHIRQSTSPVTGFNIMKTIVGAGIFATARAIDRSGFFFGIALILVMGAVFYWSIMTLVRASVVSGTKSIQELVRLCFGIVGEYFLNFFLFAIAWGSIAAYTVILGDVLPDVLNVVMGVPTTPFMHFFLSRRGQVIIISIFVLLPVSASKDLRGLGKFSGLALACIVFIITTVLAVAPTLTGGDPNKPGTSWKGDTSQPLPIIKVSGIQSAIATFSFAYVCQHNILLNYHQMKRKSINRFAWVTRIVIGLTVILTLMVGMAYLTFRENSNESNILNAFPKDITIISVCRLLFAIDMCFTYPLELFVCRDTLEKLLAKGKPFSNIRHYAFTLVILASTVLTGSFTCDLGAIIDVTGGVGAAIVAFVIPSGCYLRARSLKGETVPLKTKIPHCCLVVFGIALTIMTIASTVLEIVNHDPSKPPKDCRFNGI